LEALKVICKFPQQPRKQEMLHSRQTKIVMQINNRA